jgi:hypothetical protein
MKFPECVPSPPRNLSTMIFQDPQAQSDGASSFLVSKISRRSNLLVSSLSSEVKTLRAAHEHSLVHEYDAVEQPQRTSGPSAAPAANHHTAAPVSGHAPQAPSSFLDSSSDFPWATAPLHSSSGRLFSHRSAPSLPRSLPPAAIGCPSEAS